jgi:hypothetical protein
MRRLYLIMLIGLGVVVFVVISALLARIFLVDGRERSALTSLVEAEARGDRQAMIDQLYHCPQTPGCIARASADAATLQRKGAVSIVDLTTSAGVSLTGTLGTARVAWKTPSSLPIVQCFRVRRAGNVLKGITIELLEISARIESDSSCPPHY